MNVPALIMSLVAACAVPASIPIPDSADPPSEAVVYFVGDSITNGAGAIYPSRDGYVNLSRGQLCGQYQTCRARVLTVAGSGGCLVVTCNNVPSLQSTWVSGVLNATPTPTTVYVEIGINDLFANITDQQYGDAYKYLFDQANARGIRVILGTMTPSTTGWPWHATHNPQRLGINNWIRTYLGMDNVVDFDAVLRIGTSGDADPNWYSSDGLHPNQNGHYLMSLAVSGTFDRIQ